MNVHRISNPYSSFLSLDEILQDVPEAPTEEIDDIEEIYQSYKEELNQELKTKDRVWLEFHAGLCRHFGKAAKSILYRIVKSSVNKPENSIAAANAITILKVIDVSFVCLDLKGIKIPQADLSGAILDRVNLSYADLREVCLKGASLNQTKLKKAILKDIKFGLENFKIFAGRLRISCYSYETHRVLIVPYDPKEFNVIFKRLALICSNKVVALVYNILGINEYRFDVQVYTIDPIDSTSDQCIFNPINMPISIPSTTIVSLFHDCLITIEPQTGFSYIISLLKFNEDAYEKKYATTVPYKIIEDLIPALEIVASPTSSLLLLRAIDSLGKNTCIIFDYKIGEILSCIELDKPFSQAVVSSDMQYLAVTQYNKLTVYRLIKSHSSTSLSAEILIKPISVDMSTEYHLMGKIEFAHKNRYIVFVNRNNEVEVVDFFNRKSFYYSTGFIVKEFYVDQDLEKIVICSDNIIETIYLDKLLNPLVHPTPHISSLVEKNAIDFCVSSEEDKEKNNLVEVLHVINADQDFQLFYNVRQISSYVIDSNGILPRANDIVELDVRPEDATPYVRFSPNASFMILRKTLTIAYEVELYTRSNGKLFHTFPKVYSPLVLSSNEEYAAYIAEDSMIQIWHLPSKSILYIIENYPLEAFKSLAIVSKKYMILHHTAYIRVLSLHNKLNSYLKEIFSDAIVHIDIPCFKLIESSILLYNDHTILFADSTKIYVYDLENSSNKKVFDFAECGVIQHFDVSSTQGLGIVYSIDDKHNSINSVTISLFNIITGKVIDSVSYGDRLKHIRFSSKGRTIIGWSENQFYIWQIRQSKLCLIYRGAAGLFKFHGIDLREAEIDKDFQNLIALQNQT